jgi:polyisoprenoid-binding protein YceI
MFHRVCVKTCLAVLVQLVGIQAIASQAVADEFAVDPAHSGINFKIAHLGLSWIQGRFDQFGGQFTIDTSDPEKCSFVLSINPASIDTNNQKRDDHLRSPDFLNVKQFPAMNFKSTSVRAAQGGYDVTGDFTMHGVTKPMTLSLVGGRTAEFPKGVSRTGFSAEFVLKRSEFGIEKFTPSVGDKVYVAVSFEGTRK